MFWVLGSSFQDLGSLGFRVPALRFKYYSGVSLGIKIGQKPYIVWSVGPKALIYESLDP